MERILRSEIASPEGGILLAQLVRAGKAWEKKIASAPSGAHIMPPLTGLEKQ
jgi:hypothetical protein